MNFRAFREKYQGYPVIKSSYFALEPKPLYLRRLVSEWCRKGWLLELRRGMYLIDEDHVLERTERFYVANQLYQPSYVSLESALSFYGMIPEGVAQITSVGTRKTTEFTNPLGTFRYAHIKTELFWGLVKSKMQRAEVLLASPEKAVLDLVYLRKGELNSAAELLESMRLENLEILDREGLLEAGRRFGHPKVIRVVGELSKLVKRKGRAA